MRIEENWIQVSSISWLTDSSVVVIIFHILKLLLSKFVEVFGKLCF